MLKPHAGLQAFHNGEPVEFLYRVSSRDPTAEQWRVRPLFVEACDRDAVYRPGDRLTRVHSSGPSDLPPA